MFDNQRSLWSRSFVLLAIAMVFAARAEGADAESKPNFIVFLTDDQGWGDLGCYGHPRIQSPNLDRFAKEGMRLTQCYSACSVCSPSRSAILTGRTPYRNGVWRWIPERHETHLRTSEITIPSLLKERGYDTCHVGKWHLNGYFNSDQQPQPDDHGYDHWFATQNNAAPNHLNPVNFVRNREPAGKLEGPSAVLVVEEAIHWLERRSDKMRPFFLTVWTHEPHLPIETAEQFMEPYQDLPDPDLRQHHGNVTQMDYAFGKLMAAIETMKYHENTVVFYTADNGPEGDGTKGRTRGSTGGLRGRKRHSHEGGIRVPGIVRWPGHVQPGSESSQPVIGSDIFTTICDIVDIPLPTDRTIDGASMLPMFKGQAIERNQPLYWRNHLAPDKYKVALRIGDWKIIGSRQLETRSGVWFCDLRRPDNLSRALDGWYTPEGLTALLKQDAAVLAEGPNWWKNEPAPKKRK
ncbi:MAG: sulfatase-like hydrolase/transferase [Planctomycetales bacterium]|nr:sulfatase-like hydrolase/transferase [Planctomycetales bacterium]